MKRILPGLAMACLVTGCADQGAAPSSPTADSSPQAPAAEGSAKFTTVSLKVPGMH